MNGSVPEAMEEESMESSDKEEERKEEVRYPLAVHHAVQDPGVAH